MPDPRKCSICGEPFTPDKFHPDTTMCSLKCRASRDAERKRASRAGARVVTEAAAPVSYVPTEDELIKRAELAALEKRVRAETGRTRILCDLLLESVAQVNAKTIKPHKPSRYKTDRDPETMVVLRSDLHPGIITPSYNLDVFHRRMNLFTEKIILIYEIMSKTIPIEKIVFVDLGDLVSGQGIFPNQAWESEKNVLEQIYHEAVPEIISQDLAMLDYVPAIEDHYVPGNHGRTGKDMPDQVNFDNILAQDVWRRFEFVDRVDVQPEWGKFKFVNIYGWRFLCTHGNLIRSWMNVPFYGIINKGMRWQGSLKPTRAEIQQELVGIIKDSELTPQEKADSIIKVTASWHYMLHGHFHVDFDFPWNDFRVIANGTLASDDDFALEVLGMSSNPVQQVFGVHPEHGVTWRYPLDLS